MFSSRFMLFPTFFFRKNKFPGGGGLPCFHGDPNKLSMSSDLDMMFDLVIDLKLQK